MFETLGQAILLSNETERDEARGWRAKLACESRGTDAIQEAYLDGLFKTANTKEYIGASALGQLFATEMLMNAKESLKGG